MIAMRELKRLVDALKATGAEYFVGMPSSKVLACGSASGPSMWSPKVTFVARLRPSQLPDQAARQLRINRQLSGWNPPPLMIRALGALPGRDITPMRAALMPALIDGLSNQVDILILLRQKVLRGDCLAIGAAQQGHRGSVLTRAAMRRRRIVAIEFGI